MPSAVRAATVLALVAIGCAFPAAARATDVSPADALERRLVARINDYRASHDASTLTVRRRLERAAARHAANLAWNGYFSHDWSTGEPFGTWIRRYWPGPGYSTWSAGENLFWAAPDVTAADVFRGWNNSPGHDENMLRRSWRGVGLGAVRVRNPGGVYSRFATVTIVAAEFGYRR